MLKTTGWQVTWVGEIERVVFVVFFFNSSRAITLQCICLLVSLLAVFVWAILVGISEGSGQACVENLICFLTAVLSCFLVPDSL